MPDRLYFIFGDIASNLITGAMVGMICYLFINTNWNMMVAMLIAMPVGMFLALVLGLLLFYRYFGANEVMVPTMLTGMLSGMLVAMLLAMKPLSLIVAMGYGAITGLICLLFCNYCDYLIRGNRNIVDREL